MNHHRSVLKKPITTTIVHSFNNYHVARYQSHLSFTWTLMDQCAKSPPFQQLPEGAIVYAPSLPRANVTYDMLTNTVGDYWEDYIHVVSGKRLHLVYSLADLASHSNETVYYFGLNKMPKDFQAYAVLGRLNAEQTQTGNVADEFDLMTYQCHLPRRQRHVNRVGLVQIPEEGQAFL